MNKRPILNAIFTKNIHTRGCFELYFEYQQRLERDLHYRDFFSLSLGQSGSDLCLPHLHLARIPYK